MTKIPNAFQWGKEVAQVLVLDRFSPRRRHLAELASTACRTLRFHSRCKIKPQRLAGIIKDLGCSDVPSVVTPGPSTEFGDVGSQGGYNVLGALVAALQPNTILEFGTYLGVSALAMALNAKSDCRIFTVDLPDDALAEDIADLNALDQRHVTRSRSRVGQAFSNHPLRERITQIRADSMTFRAETVVPGADLVYVDGGHSMPLITADTENAFRVLAEAGTIVWDDYFHLYPDVVDFLDRLADTHRLIGIAGTNYVIYSRRWDKSA